MKTTRREGVRIPRRDPRRPVRHLGEPATVAVMTDDRLRSKVNAAANAPTAGRAAAIALALVVKLVEAFDAAAAEVNQ